MERRAQEESDQAGAGSLDICAKIDDFVDKSIARAQVGSGGGGGGVARPKYSAAAINAYNKATVEEPLSEKRQQEREERLERLYRFQEAGRLPTDNLIRQYVAFGPFIERRRAFLREKGSKWVKDETYEGLFDNAAMDEED